METKPMTRKEIFGELMMSMFIGGCLTAVIMSIIKGLSRSTDYAFIHGVLTTIMVGLAVWAAYMVSGRIHRSFQKNG